MRDVEGFPVGGVEVGRLSFGNIAEVEGPVRREIQRRANLGLEKERKESEDEEEWHWSESCLRFWVLASRVFDFLGASSCFRGEGE